MKKIESLSDVQSLSDHEFDWLKQTVESEIKRRGTPDFEVFELIRIDDGCEGFFMDIEDFQECARHKDNEDDWDLIDAIEQTLLQGSSIDISVANFPKDSVGRASFFGKDNPYKKTL